MPGGGSSLRDPAIIRIASTNHEPILSWEAITQHHFADLTVELRCLGLFLAIFMGRALLT